MNSFTKIARSVSRRLKTQPRRRHASNFQSPGVQTLEVRRLPAQMISPTQLKYQDQDGDNVTVTFSKSILNAGNVNSIFEFNTGSVNGNTTTKQQLKSINLVGIAGAAGTTITTLATRSASTGGDGLAAVGQINASGLDLSTIKIDGDLGRIITGDANSSTAGVGTLTVHSMGRYGMATGAPDLNSTIHGKLTGLVTKTDFKNAAISVTGGTNGTIGLLTIGHSLIGGDTPSGGSIDAHWNIGPVKIGHDLVGGAGANSGWIYTDGKIASVTIGGSILGGTGNDSGKISSFGDVGSVKVAGDIVGGLGGRSGSVSVLSKLTGLTVGGSVVGGAGFRSGGVYGEVAMGAIAISGSLIGGAGSSSGTIYSVGPVASIAIKGSMVGGSGNFSGSTRVNSNVGALSIGKNIVGGSAFGSASLEYSGTVIVDGRLSKITVGGALIAGYIDTLGTALGNGAVLVRQTLGPASFGSIVGNTTNTAQIVSRGDVAGAAPAMAIASLTVKGRVERAQILAGYSTAPGYAAQYADAQIGAVKVGGDWIASDLIASATAVNGYFGDADDVKASGAQVFDDPAVNSKITSISIGGQVLGTPGVAGDHFGFVAQSVGSFVIGGATIPMTSGLDNDHFFVGIGGDVRVNEI